MNTWYKPRKNVLPVVIILNSLRNFLVSHETSRHLSAEQLNTELELRKSIEGWGCIEQKSEKITSEPFLKKKTWLKV